MQTVRYGVIGLGWFGEKHCEALAAIPGVEIRALCTRRPDRLAEVAHRFQVRNTYSDYTALLDDPEIDAVSIVTMWDQHAAPTLAALAAGKHVFLEKPMASTVEECQKIVDAADLSRGSLMVGHICRFNPRYAAARQAIEEGRIGKIISMYARRNIPALVTADLLNKIGPIIGDGVHDTDLMLWYSQAKIVTAYAQTGKFRNLKHPDLGWTMYRFDSGAIGVLENVWCLPDKTPFQIDERMEIIGTEGSIQIHESAPNFGIVDSKAFHYTDTTYWPELHGQRAGALRDELAYFTQCIRDGRRPDVVSPRDAMAAVTACLAAEKSAATGQVVTVVE
jgi:UDP-N-acetylglucosamine 3-dehydrogenase